ncbi:SEA (Seh1-associated) complex subunit [Onygenales sp. PD_40]|nr:SEA (Seh1-associated) complex subunit [Onygenales sp. PD_40]KAK2772899.1 SEA (Seh1-associated) complex subunit [Emmonsiellopsis sp. PD_33]KAK2806851.1 SEA (Seh1-associated) complex subunit [Onygenales sp. PD_10]
MPEQSPHASAAGAAPPPPPPPPPAPSLPPQRYATRATSAFARFAHPFIYGSRPPSPQQSAPQEAPIVAHPRHSIARSGPSQTIAYQTKIRISALDISPQRTHAVVAGREILKTIRVTPDHCVEDFDLRASIIGYHSSHHVSTGALSAKHKDQLAAKDVKWSHGEYDRIIATAAANGRIVIYDLNRPGLELGRLQEHNRQVHRLAFNPHRGAWLLSGSQDATIRMWDLRMVSGDRGAMNFGSKTRFNGHSEAVRDIRWSPADGVEFATATDSGAIHRWDVRKDNAPLMKINAHEKACFSIDWHPDGKHVVSGSTDKQVKVWDFSSTDRRQKPCFQLRAPQSVNNVRWRPPSWASETQESGNWQSTQIVTSYDQEDPRIHLWDFRRPHIPFKEFDRYKIPPTDLLWHSNDLLWTVDNDGTFTQTDVKFAPQVVQRRKPCAVAWSPSGDVIALNQRRPPRRGLNMNFEPSEFLGPKAAKAASGEKVTTSLSLTDDGLDESGLASLRKRPHKGAYARGSKSLSGTPPMSEDSPTVVSLEKAIAHSGVFEPSQVGAIGHISGATFDPEVFEYLAKHYAPLMESSDAKNEHVDILEDIQRSLDENAERAEDASLYRLAQTWRIIKYAVCQELKVRAEQLASAPEQETDSTKWKLSKDGNVVDRPHNHEEPFSDKLKSRLFKGVIETEGPARVMADPESTSNMTTPLAKPLPDSPHTGSYSDHSDGSNSDREFDNIQPLPPSVLSSHGGNFEQRVAAAEDTKSGPFNANEELQANVARAIHGPPRSPSPNRMLKQDLALPDPFSEGQRSAPRAIAGRADWRVREIPNFENRDIEEEEEEYDQKVEERRAVLQNYKLFPKRVLSLDPHDNIIKTPTPVHYVRHDSTESFPMFSASTDSSQRTKSISESCSPEASQESTGWAAAAGSSLERIAELEIGSLARSVLDQNNIQTSEDSSLGVSPFESNIVDLERPLSPLPFLAETSVVRDRARRKIRQGYTTSRESKQDPRDHPTLRPTSTHKKDGIGLPLPPAPSDSQPWSARNIIREALKHYCTNSPVDMQSAAHLLHKMHVLFSSWEQILPHEERELIFKTYNEQLLRQGMFIEAAELRLLCVPTYPSVYDYAQQDTFINVYCFECRKPYENPTRDNERCHRCGVSQPPCTICMSREPPIEWTLQYSLKTEKPTTIPEQPPTHTLPHTDSHQSRENPPTYRPHGSALWSWCQGCGHGGHTACQTAWLTDTSTSEGGCATPGCLHDCGPGPRRDQNRASLIEESKRARDISSARKSSIGFAKRDSWAAGESKAVERVRGMLGVGAGGGAGTAAAAASGAPAGPSAATGGGPGTGPTTLMSPKKVRLVTPSEEGSRGQGQGQPGNTNVKGLGIGTGPATQHRESISEVPFGGKLA